MAQTSLFDAVVDFPKKAVDAGSDYVARIGPEWSRSNAEFRKTNPTLGQEVVRGLNPLTGFGAAIGHFHDGVHGMADDGEVSLQNGLPTAAGLIGSIPMIGPIAGKGAAAVAKPGVVSKAMDVGARGWDAATGWIGKKLGTEAAETAAKTGAAEATEAAAKAGTGQGAAGMAAAQPATTTVNGTIYKAGSAEAAKAAEAEPARLAAEAAAQSAAKNASGITANRTSIAKAAVLPLAQAAAVATLGGNDGSGTGAGGKKESEGATGNTPALSQAEGARPMVDWAAKGREIDARMAQNEMLDAIRNAGQYQGMGLDPETKQQMLAQVSAPIKGARGLTASQRSNILDVEKMDQNAQQQNQRAAGEAARAMASGFLNLKDSNLKAATAGASNKLQAFQMVNDLNKQARDQDRWNYEQGAKARDSYINRVATVLDKDGKPMLHPDKAREAGDIWDRNYSMVNADGSAKSPKQVQADSSRMGDVVSLTQARNQAIQDRNVLQRSADWATNTEPEVTKGVLPFTKRNATLNDVLTAGPLDVLRNKPVYESGGLTLDANDFIKGGGAIDRDRLDAMEFINSQAKKPKK